MYHLTRKQEDILNKVYEKIPFGRDKIYKYVSENYPEAGISRRAVMSWLKTNELAQLTTTPKPKREIVSTIPGAPLSKIQMDLIDMSKDSVDGYNYIMSAVDTFSKYVWAEKLKTKRPEELKKALKNIINDAEKYGNIKAIQTDNGSEFKGVLTKFLKDNGIKHLLTSVEASSHSNGMIERMNRTIRNVLFKFKLKNKDINNWTDKLDDLVYAINNTYSRASKATPSKTIKGENEKDVKEVLTANTKKYKFQDKPVLQIGDRVRLMTLLDKHAKRSSTLRFSKDIYTIETVIKPSKNSGRPHQYDLMEVEGRYTINQLLPVDSVINEIELSDKYQVSKIEKPGYFNKVFGYWVRYTGYKDLYHVDRKTLIEDMPKEVKKIDEIYGVNYKNKKWRWSSKKS